MRHLLCESSKNDDYVPLKRKILMLIIKPSVKLDLEEFLNVETIMNVWSNRTIISNAN